MPRSADGFCPIDAALDDLRAGRMIVLVDDEQRENEGDLVMAGEAMTPAAINFMIRQACGRLCVSFSRPHADRLGLDLLPGVHLDPTATPFTHNFDARFGDHHRHLGVRPLPHRAGVRRPALRPRRHRPRQGPHGRADRQAAAACWCAPVTRKGASTCAGWRGCARSR